MHISALIRPLSDKTISKVPFFGAAAGILPLLTPGGLSKALSSAPWTYSLSSWIGPVFHNIIPTLAVTLMAADPVVPLTSFTGSNTHPVAKGHIVRHRNPSTHTHINAVHVNEKLSSNALSQKSLFAQPFSPEPTILDQKVLTVNTVHIAPVGKGQTAERTHSIPQDDKASTPSINHEGPHRSLVMESSEAKTESPTAFPQTTRAPSSNSLVREESTLSSQIVSKFHAVKEVEEFGENLCPHPCSGELLKKRHKNPYINGILKAFQSLGIVEEDHTRVQTKDFDKFVEILIKDGIIHKLCIDLLVLQGPVDAPKRLIDEMIDAVLAESPYTIKLRNGLNALFFKEEKGVKQLIMPLNGLDDIKNKLVVDIMEQAKNFIEKPQAIVNFLNYNATPKDQGALDQIFKPMIQKGLLTKAEAEDIFENRLI